MVNSVCVWVLCDYYNALKEKKHSQGVDKLSNQLRIFSRYTTQQNFEALVEGIFLEEKMRVRLQVYVSASTTCGQSEHVDGINVTALKIEKKCTLFEGNYKGRGGGGVGISYAFLRVI